MKIFNTLISKAGCALAFWITLYGCSGMLDVPGPAISVHSPSGAWSVSEAGGRLDLELRSGRRHSGEITIAVKIEDATEARTDRASVEIRGAKWDSPATFTVIGVDDDITDGTIKTKLVFGAPDSKDKSLNHFRLDPVTISVLDDETDSIAVAPVATAETSEAGGEASFTVVLTSQPTADVVIPAISVSDASEGTLDTTTLTFTTETWNIPQTITVTGVDDSILDGDQSFQVVFDNAQSADPGYSDLTTPPQEVINRDDEVPEVIVTPVTLALDEGGTVGVFTVKLANIPTSDVSFTIGNDDTRHISVDKTGLTFTPENFDQEQTVTVTPLENDFQDAQPFSDTITISAADDHYGDYDPADVTVTVSDNDAAGISVSNLSRNTTEAGQNAFFTVVLLSEPLANVSILVNETDDPLNNANQEGTIVGDPVTLVFTAANWDQPQTVTVNPVDDERDDGHTQYIIKLEDAVSADPVYNGMTPAGVTVNNIDDDTAGIIVNEIGGPGLATDDMGNLDKNEYSTFTVRLNSQPSANVVFALSSTIPSDGTPDKSSLTFTPANWDQEQSVNVHISNNGGTPNHINEGNHDYKIVFVTTTTDAKYAALSAPSVLVHSCDNDGATIVSPCRRGGFFSTSENNTYAILWYISQTQPAWDVVFSADLSNNQEAIFSTNMATITAINWNNFSTNNRLVLIGLDEPDNSLPPVFDGNTPYTILAHLTSSSDSFYQDFDVPDTVLRNVDNEQALEFDTSGSQNTAESGTSTTLGIRPGLTPAQPLTLTVSCKTGSTECGAVSPSTLTFAAGATAYQTITITGKDDDKADGSQPLCLSFSALDTEDETLKDIVPPDYCPVNNLDNDKRVWVTDLAFLGNFNATANMNSIDLNCDASAGDANHPGDGNTYKALIAHSQYRVAAGGSGQTGWVLQPSTKYYVKNGADFTTRIFTTNASGIATIPFANAIGAGGLEFWTGLNTDWTTSADNCADWSDSVTAGLLATYGVGGTTGAGALHSATASCEIAADIKKKLICVQQ